MGDDARAEWTRVEDAIEGYVDQHFEKWRNLGEASDPVQVLLSLRMDALDAIKRWAASGRLEVRHENGVIETYDWPYLNFVETPDKLAPEEVTVTCAVLDERSGVVIPHLSVNTRQWEFLLRQSLEQRASAVPDNSLITDPAPTGSGPAVPEVPSPAASEEAPAVSAPVVSQGGRPPIMTQDKVDAEVFRLMDLHGEFAADNPEWDAQARLEKAIGDYCENLTGKRPRETTLKVYIREPLQRWRQRSKT
jgi:hypothetical protein